MPTDLAFVVAAASHPSLDGAIGRFCDTVHDESHRSGSRHTRWETIPSLGLRLVALHEGAVIGFAALDATACGPPEIVVVVTGTWSRRGVDTALSDAIAVRARAAGIEPARERAMRRSA